MSFDFFCYKLYIYHIGSSKNILKGHISSLIYRAGMAYIFLNNTSITVNAKVKNFSFIFEKLFEMVSRLVVFFLFLLPLCDKY